MLSKCSLSDGNYLIRNGMRPRSRSLIRAGYNIQIFQQDFASLSIRQFVIFCTKSDCQSIHVSVLCDLISVSKPLYTVSLIRYNWRRRRRRRRRRRKKTCQALPISCHTDHSQRTLHVRLSMDKLAASKFNKIGNVRIT